LMGRPRKATSRSMAAAARLWGQLGPDQGQCLLGQVFRQIDGCPVSSKVKHDHAAGRQLPHQVDAHSDVRRLSNLTQR